MSEDESHSTPLSLSGLGTLGDVYAWVFDDMPLAVHRLKGAKGWNRGRGGGIGKTPSLLVLAQTPASADSFGLNVPLVCVCMRA